MTLRCGAYYILGRNNSIIEPLEGKEKRHKRKSMCKVAELLRKSDIDITSFSSWSKIDELRLVANTVKHADGDSADKLRCCRPDLFTFSDPVSKSILPDQFIILRQVFQPLTGKDLFVTVSDLSSYVDVIKQFWFELANTLEKIEE